MVGFVQSVFALLACMSAGVVRVNENLIEQLKGGMLELTTTASRDSV